MSDSGNLHRTLLVTGAAGRLGRAVVSALAPSFGAVALVDTDVDGVHEFAHRLAGVTEALAFAVDVTSWDDLQSAFSKLDAQGLAPDAVVTSAGISGRALGASGDIACLDPAAWRRVLEVNLDGVMLTCKAAAPGMLARRWGRIVTIASLAGRTASTTATLPYSASKAGVIGLTRALARQLAPSVLVNAVAPSKLDPGWGETDESIASYVDDVPLGRLATAVEVAEVVAFLASERNSYITGAVIDVNGGKVMQ